MPKQDFKIKFSAKQCNTVDLNHYNILKKY